MSNGNIEHVAKEIIAGIMDIDPDTITNETTFNSQSGVDSIQISEIIVALEQRFHLQLHDHNILSKINNFGDIIAYLRQYHH